jgi:hypothetical protein
MMLLHATFFGFYTWPWLHHLKVFGTRRLRDKNVLAVQLCLQSYIAAARIYTHQRGPVKIDELGHSLYEAGADIKVCPLC